MKKLLPFIAIIVLLVAILLAPVLLFRPEKYRQPLTDRLSAFFHHPVLLGPLEGHYFPPRLTLHNISIVKSGDARYATIDQATLTMGWGALFGNTAPTQVEISGAHVVINRLIDGHWDYAEWWASSGAGSTKDDHPDIVIKQSDVQWIDAFAPARVVIQWKGLNGLWTSRAHTLNLSADVSGSVLPATLNFQATGPVGLGDWSGDVKLTDNNRTATFHMRRQGTLLDINGQSSEWRLDSAAQFARFYVRLPLNEASGMGSSFLKEWKTQFSTLGSSMTLTHSAMLDGGSTELKGEIAGSNVAQATFTIALQNVPVSSLKPVGDGLTDGVDGKLTGMLSHFTMPVSSAAWQKAAGAFVFEVTNGSYRLPEATLQTLKRVKTMHYLNKKYPEFVDKGFPFATLHLQGTIEKGAINLQQAGIISGDVRAAATGRIQTESRALDLWLELNIRESQPALRKLLPERYVYGQKIQPIFGHLQGIWSEWKLRAVPHAKVSGALQKKLHL